MLIELIDLAKEFAPGAVKDGNLSAGAQTQNLAKVARLVRVERYRLVFNRERARRRIEPAKLHLLSVARSITCFETYFIRILAKV
jgi:hypothetical protein